VLDVKGCANGSCVEAALSVVASQDLTGVTVQTSGDLSWVDSGSGLWSSACTQASATAQLGASSFDATRGVAWSLLTAHGSYLPGAVDASGSVCVRYLKQSPSDAPPVGSGKLVARYYGVEGTADVLVK
jgi:hypothetical protein